MNMKKCKITVVKIACYKDLMEKYEIQWNMLAI